MALDAPMKQYAQDVQEELKQLIRDLCAIPAPSHHEEKRAAFCKTWFENAGGQGVYIDEALNVVCPWGVSEEKPVIVVMAHMDTVFPDLEPMPFREDAERFYCPGVCDDTAQLAQLMVLARYFMNNCPVPEKVGVLFIANSCEEGLGNLKGTRQIVKDYGSRMKEFVTIDASRFVSMCNEAVGSHRYRVAVRTEGGHSFGDFGKPNAIHHLSTIINTLYSIGVPAEGGSKTTYNVGLISGGTSVNTIAQQAEMLYEYRSDNLNCLRLMEAKFREIIDHYRVSGVDVEEERIGERPCSGEIDASARRALIERCAEAVRAVTGMEAVCSAGSTDANIPLSMGIPAACISVCNGGKCHTRQEWLDVSSLPDGCRLFMSLLASYV